MKEMQLMRRLGFITIAKVLVSWAGCSITFRLLVVALLLFFSVLTNAYMLCVAMSYHYSLSQMRRVLKRVG